MTTCNALAGWDYIAPDEPEVIPTPEQVVDSMDYVDQSDALFQIFAACSAWIRPDDYATIGQLAMKIYQRQLEAA
jgi:hypothetical protein